MTEALSGPNKISAINLWMKWEKILINHILRNSYQNIQAKWLPNV